MSDQGRLDFSRAEQRYLLRVVRLSIWAPPRGDGVRRDRVSESAQKSVLLSLDSFGRECWAGFESIGAAAGVSRRVAQRAVEALLARSLITKTRRWSPAAGAVRNHYRIVWSELEQLARVQAAARGEQVVTALEQVVTAPEQVVTAAPKSPIKPQEQTPTLPAAVLGVCEGGVGESVGELVRAGVGELMARRLARRFPAAVIRGAVSEFEANRGLFRGPGRLWLGWSRGLFLSSSRAARRSSGGGRLASGLGSRGLGLGSGRACARIGGPRGGGQRRLMRKLRSRSSGGSG